MPRGLKEPLEHDAWQQQRKKQQRKILAKLLHGGA
jgi:hypothetical protein